MVAGWLESDVHNCTLQIKTVINKIEKIQAGKLKHWQIIGNLFNVNIFSEFITAEYNDKECLDEADTVVNQMEMSKFKFLLEAWKDFVLSKNQATVELDI